MNQCFTSVSRIGLTACLATVLLWLGGCQKAAAPDAEAAATNTVADGKKAANDEDKDAAGADEGVALKPEEVAAMGIETVEAKALDSAPQVSGFGVVMAHEAIAQAVAELRTAVAAERQSRAALERAKRLTGTPGAMPADTQESAEKQAVADQSALELARQRLTAVFGQDPPWKQADE